MNDFTLDFLKLTHSLDPTKSHAMMVCGHARPDQCRETVPHLGADDAHPCGASDASDPAAALASGFFCELLNATTTTTHGEVLVYGKEKIEFLEQTHAEDLAAGLTPQLPVLHLEIVEIEDLLEGLDLDYEDYDFGIGPSAAPETSGPVGSPSPALIIRPNGHLWLIPVLYTYGSAHVPLRALRKESTPAPLPPWPYWSWLHQYA